MSRTAAPKAVSSRLPLRRRSRYQTLALARERGGLMFRLNGSPQVFSREEARYHEAIATVPMLLVQRPRRIAILGGGDGLAARNVLRFASAREVTLVELDPAVLDLWSTAPELVRMNTGALSDPRLRVVVGDAMRWLERVRGRFDLIVHDFEMTWTRQPTAITAGRLFAFFARMRACLAPGGVGVVTVPHDFDRRTVQQVFAAIRDEMPPAVRQDFVRRRSMEGHIGVLFRSLFPRVATWRLDLPVLGRHTNYYLGSAPMRIRRPSPVALRWFRPALFRAEPL